MASNSFGKIFRITTFGESHGKGIGVVIDGASSQLEISRDEIQKEVDRRRPGFSPYTSPRKESDQVEILSGFFEGKTTGAPIALMIANRDSDSSKYEPIKNIYRPGHANFTYLKKYGIFDYRGGGRSSARETAARVAAGAIAKKMIAPIAINSWVDSVGGKRDESSMKELIEEVMREGDSIGATVYCEISNVSPGLGDPIYDKLEAQIANAMLSIPATRGIEFGEGFEATKMRGSIHNDPYRIDEGGNVAFAKNSHGGILGGISTGEKITFRVAFKPTSSIKKAQASVTLDGHETEFVLPEGSRHDPCVALRAPPIVESMAALVLADLTLAQKSSHL